MKSKFKWRIFPKVSNDLKVQLLYNRGVISSLKKVEKEVQSFLQPDTKKDLFDPFRLRDLEKAAKRILQASKNKERVGIFGDYDADGIPGAAFLSEAFKKLGLKTLVYIPSRSEGYGFSPQAVNYFSSKGVKLIVVVDAGIKDLKACRLAKKLGIDVIFVTQQISSNARGMTGINPTAMKQSQFLVVFKMTDPRELRVLSQYIDPGLVYSLKPWECIIMNLLTNKWCKATADDIERYLL